MHSGRLEEPCFHKIALLLTVPPFVTISFWARWDIQGADSHWDRQPRHGDDLLKRGPTKITAQLRCHPCWPSLGLTVHSRRCFPEAHLHQNFSSDPLPPLKPSQTSMHEGCLQKSWSYNGLEHLHCDLQRHLLSTQPSKIAHSS